MVNESQGRSGAGKASSGRRGQGSAEPRSPRSLAASASGVYYMESPTIDGPKLEDMSEDQFDLFAKVFRNSEALWKHLGL